MDNHYSKCDLSFVCYAQFVTLFINIFMTLVRFPRLENYQINKVYKCNLLPKQYKTYSD